MRNVEKTPIFTKDIKPLPEEIQQEIWHIVNVLKENVFDNKLEIRKLEGYKKLWRVTVRKVYRLVYTFDQHNVYLLRVRHRKDIYKKLDL